MNEGGRPVRVSSEDILAKGKEKISNGVAGGSRFASLANIIENEGEDREGIDCADEGARNEEADSKGKEKVVEDEDQIEGVGICASDQSLLQGVQIIQSREMEKTDKAKPSLVGRIKERVLKDLTNKLDIQPIKLKPTRAGIGLKTNLNGILKGVGPAIDWTAHGDKQISNMTSKVGPSGSLARGDPYKTKPPDVSRRDSGRKSLDPQIEARVRGQRDGAVETLLESETGDMEQDEESLGDSEEEATASEAGFHGQESR